MDSIRDFLWLAILLGVLVGLALWRYLFAPGVTLLHRRMLARHIEKSTSPKGTRPTVKMRYDGLVYDLTDSLLRAEDDNGWAVWVVLGPEHLNMTTPPEMEIEVPVPRQTHVMLPMQGMPTSARFSTLAEIRDNFTLLE